MEKSELLFPDRPESEEETRAQNINYNRFIDILSEIVLENSNHN